MYIVMDETTKLSWAHACVMRCATDYCVRKKIALCYIACSKILKVFIWVTLKQTFVDKPFHRLNQSSQSSNLSFLGLKNPGSKRCHSRRWRWKVHYTSVEEVFWFTKANKQNQLSITDNQLLRERMREREREREMKLLMIEKKDFNNPIVSEYMHVLEARDDLF